ncbi:hypothetical protein Tsubulata_031318 [Turnera subulata]|uniref:Uncharacterized protein n=1 Tax=Turnera subulata TaxID=218843 RepID=A0A9Q0JPF4_9ROSI|nr:hypothetical protein Tsubulata_031318 [Turnera subulata]
MAEMLGVRAASQSSLLLLEPSSRLGFFLPALAAPQRPLLHLQQRSITPSYPKLSVSSASYQTRVGAVSSDTRAPPSTIVTDNVDLSTEGIDFSSEPDTGNGGDNFGEGGRGGGGGGGGDGDSKEEGDESGEEQNKKKEFMELSMSQKLTLVYAALVGFGGLMGYWKSGSQKSLLAGGLATSLLYYVSYLLPSNPVKASSIGLGVSAALMAVMGSRFLKSGKVFPAGVVSFVSFIMAGGYIHGILRTKH